MASFVSLSIFAGAAWCVFTTPAHAQEKVPIGKSAEVTAKTRHAPADMKKAGYTITFSDEFKGDKLNPKKWIDSYPFGARTHNNGEQEYYAPDGVLVENESLRFKAEKREMGGMPYTSGMATTFGKFAQRYGWFEIRAKMPKGKGMWPAFWLLPEDGKSWPPEIDILEILGHEPSKVHMTNHWRIDTGTHHEGKGVDFTGPDFTTGYHTYALQWTPEEMVWYIDGIERYATRQHVPQEPMYVLLNLAVGGDWPGNPDDTTPFPSYMDTDYIRVYAKK